VRERESRRASLRSFITLVSAQKSDVMFVGFGKVARCGAFGFTFCLFSRFCHYNCAAFSLLLIAHFICAVVTTKDASRFVNHEITLCNKDTIQNLVILKSNYKIKKFKRVFNIELKQVQNIWQ